MELGIIEHYVAAKDPLMKWLGGASMIRGDKCPDIPRLEAETPRLAPISRVWYMA